MAQKEEKDKPLMELEDFKDFPKQYIVLNANPVVCVKSLEGDRPVVNEDQIIKKIKNLRSSMEGNVLYHFNADLDFDKEKENLDTVLQIKEQIFKSLKTEDEIIQLEINELKKNNFTKESIESEQYDLSGTSYTSLLVYVNEQCKIDETAAVVTKTQEELDKAKTDEEKKIKQEKTVEEKNIEQEKTVEEKQKDQEKEDKKIRKELSKTDYSFQAKPGEVIIAYINDNFKEDRYWRFPKILIRAMLANTYFYTRMNEMCQYTQVKEENNHLKQCAQIMYQCFKVGICRKMNNKINKGLNFYPKIQKDYNELFSCVLMPAQKYKELLKLQSNFQATEGKKFILPGFLTANKKKEDCFKNFLSPFGNQGNYVKVVFKINIDQEGSKDGTRTTFIDLCKNYTSKLQVNDSEKAQKALTLETSTKQVLFASPMFSIQSHQHFGEGWFQKLDNEKQKLFTDKCEQKNPKAKRTEILYLQYKLMGKEDKDVEFLRDENGKDGWKKSQNDLPENLAITKNRPFYIFEVNQVSYKEQYEDYSIGYQNLNLLAVLGKGAGGYGEIFLSKIRTHYYAVKKYSLQYIIDEKKVDQVKREIKTMKDLKHPNLLGLSYITRNKSDIYVSTPFAYGGDLHSLYTTVKKDVNRFFHEELILQWAQQMIKGVGELHRNNLVHNDLNLTNLLVQASSNIVICDFGLVSECTKEQKKENKDKKEQNDESAEGIDQNTDWLSIGKIIYQLMYLKKPDPTNTDWENARDGTKYTENLKNLVKELLVKDQDKTKKREKFLEHEAFKEEVVKIDEKEIMKKIESGVKQLHHQKTQHKIEQNEFDFQNHKLYKFDKNFDNYKTRVVEASLVKKEIPNELKTDYTCGDNTAMRMTNSNFADQNFDETTDSQCALGEDCKKFIESKKPGDKKIQKARVEAGVFYNEQTKKYCHKKCATVNVSPYKPLADLNDFFTEGDKWTIKEENLEDEEGDDGIDDQSDSD